MDFQIDEICFGVIHSDVLNSTVQKGRTFSLNVTIDDVTKQFLKITSNY
jgi:hypothetical protein